MTNMAVEMPSKPAGDHDHGTATVVTPSKKMPSTTEAGKEVTPASTPPASTPPLQIQKAGNKRIQRDCMSHFSPPKKIQSGNFSTVFRSVHKSTGTRVVLKTLTRHASRAQNGFVAREQWCLENLEHPNIVRTPPLLAHKMGLETGTFKKEDGSIVMIQEEANGGDLFDHVDQSGHLEEAEARRLSMQFLSAMSYLHGNGVVHLDIKIENVLLHKADPSADLELKVADFGLCRLAQEFGDKIDAVVDRNGTEEFMSPEMHLSRRPFGGKQADMWAVGICLFILLTGFPPMTVAKASCPWFSLINKGRYTLFWNKVDNVLKDSGRPVPSQKAKDLINQLLNVDPSSRISADDALKHPFCRAPADTAAILTYLTKVEHACIKAAARRWFDVYRQEKEQAAAAACAVACTAVSHLVAKRATAGAFDHWKRFTKKANRINRVSVFSGSLSNVIVKVNLRHAILNWKRTGGADGVKHRDFTHVMQSKLQCLCICCALLRWTQVG